MRILLIQNEFALSGAPLCAFQLGKFLKSEGHEVFACAPNPGELTKNYNDIGIKCVADPNLFADPHSSQALAKQVDLVIVFTTPAYQCIYGAKAAGKPVIYSIHEVSEIGVNWARENMIFRKALNMADHVVFPSNYLKTKFKPYLKSTKVSVIPNGINPVDTLELPRNQSDKFKLILVGSIEPRKNQLMAIDAIKDLKDVELSLVGRPLHQVYYSQVVNAAQKAGNVAIANSQQRADMPKILNQHDCLLITSLEETQGLTALEAFSHSKPVIASDIGSLDEIVKHEDNGLLFNVNNVNDLRAKIEQLKDNKELRRTLGASGLSFLKENRKPEQHDASYSEIIKGVLS